MPVLGFGVVLPEDVDFNSIWELTASTRSA
jgi:hypothetical protein